MHKRKKEILNLSRRMLLDSKMTEKQIAKSLYISESSLRQLYIKIFNIPPKRYIRIVKLKKAKTLLRTSDKSISEIAYTVNYINASKFSAAFKSIYKISPSNYRKNCGFGVDKK